MSYGLDKAIAKAIVQAQAASDGGKGIDDLIYRHRFLKRAYRNGYGLKDEYISQAIAMIRKTRDSGFRYFCTLSACPGFPVIVYFEFRDRQSQIRWQISFHSSNEDFLQCCGGFKGHWDNGCSRDTAEKLCWYFRLH